MADLKSLEAQFDAAIKRVQNDLNNLRAQVQAQKAAPSLSAEDQATIDRLEQKANALDPTDSTTLADVGTDQTPPASSAPSTPTT